MKLIEQAGQDRLVCCAKLEEIRLAFKRRAFAVHPDKGGTEALAAQINAARDLLLQERKRR